MRTTVMLDEDLARLLADEARRLGRPVDHLLDEIVRRGLARGGAPQAFMAAELPPYQTIPHHAKLRDGVDPTGFNRLANEMEDDLRRQKI